MPIKNGQILDLIDHINTHFIRNINNRFLRKAYMVMKLPQGVWETLEGIDEKASYRKLQGYQFEEIYDIILAGAAFVHNARHDVKPRLKSLVDGSKFSSFTHGDKPGASDKILREMAVSNFDSNLSIFSDQINELYLKTVNLDKATNKKCIYEKIPELKQVGQLLIDS